MHHWDDHDPGATVEPRDGSVIRMIENSGKNTSERACHALFDGQVDALGVTESQLPTLLANIRSRSCSTILRRSKRAISATRKISADHARAGAAEAVGRQPSRIARASCFNFTVDAKALGAALAPGDSEFGRSLAQSVSRRPSKKYFNSDPWAYGLAANRHVLEKFFAYCHAQGISGRELSLPKRFSIRARSRLSE